MDNELAPTQRTDAPTQQIDPETQPHEIRCCCGSPQCAVLKHNTAALEGLEKDLLSAAQIGQALLVRHETHMAEAEEERFRMNSTIERLEHDKTDLEAANARMIEENRNLLDQLEGLNNLVSESDIHIQELTATLQATQQELQRLTVLAGRTASLEQQLTNLEVEQAQLQSQLKTSSEDNRTTIQRWKRAEGTIGHLQEQIDRIEKEAKEERERHVEIMGRLERRRAVEKELEHAAGRLKGAAAVSSLGKYNGNGSNVVSHFVKDILQDNANLQMGIVELRGLLMESNAEVENLRHKIELHQPLEDGTESQQILGDELAAADPSTAQIEIDSSQMDVAPVPELHVHHHYHGPEITVRKPKKKRPSLTSAHFLGSGASTPRAQRVRDWRSATPSSSATILSQTSVTVPPVRVPHQHRWSTQTASSFAPSSVPSSPRRTSSIFDNMDSVFDSSRPTTPESSVPGSPIHGSQDPGTMQKITYRSISNPIVTQNQPPMESSKYSGGRRRSEDRPEDIEVSDISELSLPPPASIRLNSNSADFVLSPGPEPIPEEIENEEMLATPTSSATSYLDELETPSRRLRRAASHESLLSVSGMDIHTLRSRPSQLLVSGLGFSPRPSLSPAIAALKSTQPVFSPETATARPSITTSRMDSGSYTRSLLSQQRSRNSPSSSPFDSSGYNITKRVGGWVWSKWGVAPSPSSEDHTGKSPAHDRLAAAIRAPGVNQSGPIKGLKPPQKTPSQVVPNNVDDDALGEALAEGGLL